MANNAKHLGRVRRKIGRFVLRFARQHNVKGKRQFHLEELVKFVLGFRPGLSPSSPGRILQAMKRDGWFGYTVLSRKKSLYRMDWVIKKGAKPTPAPRQTHAYFFMTGKQHKLMGPYATSLLRKAAIHSLPKKSRRPIIILKTGPGLSLIHG